MYKTSIKPIYENKTCVGYRYFLDDIPVAQSFWALIDEKKELEKKNEKLAEKCAVLAWNHFMEVCNRKRVSPSGNEDWCAAQHIRDNWRK